ncbi:GreA/GreB family elongation factor [Sphingomonas hylomeconis]|uniref:GreA/GreB family elongation factor n=1 Tax=Sphingomonas hylomeconis TaxID=1395958 RepID=A0ABV7SY07_9SPHN|nr:GreA/GreB family elongation factor [Sphingomonas hylomeconis]
MSVAFRRDSDEEVLEPKFEMPIAPGPNLVTARGLRLLNEKVIEIQAAVAAATEDGARDELKRTLRYWHTRQTTAELAPAPAPGVVGIGSSVTVRMNRAERVIHIVGGDEAAPASGLVGFQAPLPQALIGAEVGERVEFNGVADAIEILAIEHQGD